MNTFILNSFPYQFDREALLASLRIRPVTYQAEEFDQFLLRAEGVARPKVIYKVAFIEEKGPEHVIIDGVQFKSRIMRVNLDKVQRVFPYIVTCGNELEAWQEGTEDVVQRFWIDAIKEQALEFAFAAFDQHLNQTFAPGSISSMNPGSLEDWPLPEQSTLFALLGEVEAAVGVRLTESYLMLPNKTVSGLVFPTETTFASCQLCPRSVCPNRRAPYEPGLMREKYLIMEKE
jgi:hypothetical protein